MSILLVDTNVVSILFNRRHPLRESCVGAVAGHELLISFMTRSELLLWPAANNRGEVRRDLSPSRRRPESPKGHLGGWAFTVDVNAGSCV